MKVYKDGMTLMKDTASLANALMENKTREIKVGDTFAELMWTDRHLWIVTNVISPREFVAERVQTEMRDGWQDGTEYPKTDAEGKYLTSGYPETFKRKHKYWYLGESRVRFSWGATTGYRDPSF